MNALHAHSLPIGRLGSLPGVPCGPVGDTAFDFGIELADGRHVDLSPVGPGDAGDEQDFVGALSLDSRYRRFHFGLRELAPEQLRALTDIDQRSHVAFVAHPRGEHRIVADARYVRRADSADAEFAIAVADHWQAAGLGRALLTSLAAHARRAGLQRLYGDVLWANPPMLGLVRSLGATLRRIPSDATVARAEFVLDARRGAVSPDAIRSASARAS